jgi:3-hydroxyacyl-[acyl-carrier-protein] dehydratase
MPGMPLMPGVIMCEAAAQLSSYFIHRHNLMEADVVGFGGLEDVRFRGVVRPGDRFVIVSRMLKIRRAIMTCEFQCFVNQNVVCEGILKGVALPKDIVLGAQGIGDEE